MVTASVKTAWVGMVVKVGPGVGVEGTRETVVVFFWIVAQPASQSIMEQAARFFLVGNMSGILQKSPSKTQGKTFLKVKGLYEPA
jgi:hypothetical protein